MCTNPFPLERPETVAIVWPVGNVLPIEVHVEDYVSQFATDRSLFVRVQDGIGWHITEEQWSLLLTEMVPDSMVFVMRDGDPVAVACALSRADGWVELAWVAVVPEFRSMGLGKMVCSVLVQHLLTSGHHRVYGSTQDERLAALSIYLGIGFHPVYREDKVKRWVEICSNLGRSFSPELWGWPLDMT